jgi:catechol 2,3-dioxygenase-like lactoylglutathione lyase family enzyme
MHLEHLNLVVKNMGQTLTFYQAAFPHWKIRGKGTGLWYGKSRNWLHFGDDEQYLTFNDNGVGNNRDLTSLQLGLCHFAFVTDAIEQVISRLTTAGFTITNNGGKEEYRQNVYFIDPNGYEVEFVQYFSDLPSERNLYS